jgi:hypothetical protein
MDARRGEQEEIPVVLVKSVREFASALLHLCVGIVNSTRIDHELRVTLLVEELAASAAVPTLDDEIEIAGERYAIVEIERDASGYRCRCRSMPALALSRSKTVRM